MIELVWRAHAWRGDGDHPMSKLFWGCWKLHCLECESFQSRRDIDGDVYSMASSLIITVWQMEISVIFSEVVNKWNCDDIAFFERDLAHILLRGRTAILAYCIYFDSRTLELSYQRIWNNSFYEFVHVVHSKAQIYKWYDSSPTKPPYHYGSQLSFVPLDQVKKISDAASFAVSQKWKSMNTGR